jgi:hypothetical protein
VSEKLWEDENITQKWADEERNGKISYENFPVFLGSLIMAFKILTMTSSIPWNISL